MDESKKKIVLIVVAVAALGFTGYTMFGGGSGNNQAQETNNGPAVRKVRENAPTAATKTRRAERKPTRAAPKTVTRAEREEPERKSVTRKSRRDRGKKIEKKKKMAPAA